MQLVSEGVIVCYYQVVINVHNNDGDNVFVDFRAIIHKGYISDRLKTYRDSKLARIRLVWTQP